MVIPIPFSPPTQQGPPTRYAMKLKTPLQVTVGLIAAVFIWSFVFVFYVPNFAGNRLQDAIIYGVFTGVGVYAQKEMDVWWVSWFGMMCLIYGIYSLVWFLDNWIRHAILPFTGSADLILMHAILWVPAIIMLAAGCVSMLIWKNYGSDDYRQPTNGWGNDSERQPLNRAAVNRSESNFEPFTGSANRLGSQDN